MKPATIIIPYADYHSGIVERAIASAAAQTILCEVKAGLSPKTPSIFRNKAAKSATTPFVVFLDADDVLDRTFMERCLEAYQTGSYIYTSWYEGDYIHKPANCAWSANSHHIVTTLYPAALFNHLGGFDESLIGHEDADFYMRSSSRLVCGRFLDQPLVSRPEDSGKRSKQFQSNSSYSSIIQSVVERNGGLTQIMACCGGVGIPAEVSAGQQLPTDVLAQTLWMGTRSENGHVTGRMYIGGNGSKVWIDPRDLERTPHLFKKVEDLSQLAPKREIVLKESGLI